MTSHSKGIVMRSPVRIVPTGDTYYEYHIVYAPLKEKLVTRQEAMDYIRENGLVEALDCDDGTVWDTPDKAFKRKHKGFVAKNYVAFRHHWG